MALTTTRLAKTMSEPNTSTLTTVLKAQCDKDVGKQLKKTILRLTETEANIAMFRRMIARNVATNDIRNFVQKQMCIKKSKIKFDKKVQRSAMKSKLDDALSLANRLRQQKNRQRYKLFRKVGNTMARKVIRDLDSKSKSYRAKCENSDKAKFDQCMKKTKVVRHHK